MKRASTATIQIGKDKNSPAAKKNYIRVSTLVLLAFASAFFPRLLDSLGAPSPINFFHFATVPFVFVVAIVKTRSQNYQQISIVKELLFGLWLFLTVSFASALWNGAGAINVILGFLLLAEPFMLLVAIVSIPMSSSSFERIQSWMAGFVFVHLLLVYVQYGLGFCHLPGDCDNIQGIFYRSGSGHVVGASVSCSFAAYYFVSATTKPMWLRALVFSAGFLNIQLADAKQVLFMLS